MCEKVDFSKYPNLSLLLWDCRDKILEAAEAFYVLDSRLEKYLTEDSLNAGEKALIKSLANEYGSGICGPVIIGDSNYGFLPSEVIDIIKCHVDSNMIMDNDFFLGGTALPAIRYGKTRPFIDIEFLSSGKTSLSTVKSSVAEITDLRFIRQPRLDKNSVTLWVDFRGYPCKLVFLQETILDLSQPVDCFGMQSLNDVDLMAIKIMRCADSHFFIRDKAGELADVLTIYRADPSVLKTAWINAVSAYGTSLHERVLDMLTADNLSTLFKDCGIREEKAAALLKTIPAFMEDLSFLLNAR